MILRYVLFLCFVWAISETAQASTYMEQSCPNSITGEILKVEDQDDVDHMMSKVIVTIEDKDQDETVTFKYPKFAINKFIVGEAYQVGMRKGKVCFVERVM